MSFEKCLLLHFSRDYLNIFTTAVNNITQHNLTSYATCVIQHDWKIEFFEVSTTVRARNIIIHR